MEDLEKLGEAMKRQIDAHKERVSQPNYGTASPTEVDKTCLTWWFPRLVAAGLPVPETRYVLVGNWKELGRALFDGEDSQVLDGLCSMLNALVKSSRINYPCFLRTGHFSGKHDWEKTCFVKDSMDLRGNLIELANMEEIYGAVAAAKNPQCVWVVREMLPTKPQVTCEKYGNFPIARELRVFVDYSTVVYDTPYWPKGAIEDGNPKEPNWRDKLPALQSFSVEELSELHELASQAGKACGGQWSVDLLETDRGWYITDMAEAVKSYGYDKEKFDNA